MRIRRVTYEVDSGVLDLSDLKRKICEKTATVYIENPSYLGFIETRGKEISEITHDKGALFTVGVDPISLGILKPPGSYGADIVVGEGQPLGNSMNFGGPLLGIFACHGELPVVRQMPGRLVGMAPTRGGSARGFCMVLQTREQHIRRQKATSNICSNEALNAVASTVYLALLGPSGLKELGETIMAKSNYAMKRLAEIRGVETPIFNDPHFKEFTVRYLKGSVHEIHQYLLKNNVHGGKDVSGEFSQLGKVALYCVTEIHSQEDIDKLVELLGEAMTKGG